MLRFILLRLVGSFVVLMITSVLLFYLSDAIPGDPILQAIDSEFEGSQSNGMNDALYAQKAIELHKNLPKFYFTIIPNCVADSIYSKIINPAKQQEFIYNRINSKTSFLSEVVENTFKDYLPHFFWYGTENQYHYFLRGFLNFDVGKSTRDGVPIFQKMKKPLRVTLILSILALLFSVVGAWFFGLAQVRNPNNRFFKIIERAFDVVYAMPTFWIATLSILFFCTPEFHLKIFPSPGLPDTFIGNHWSEYFTHFHYFFLPALCMSLHLFIVLAQHFKASLLENASENYFTTARAKGLTYSQSVRKHLVPNAVFPFVTLVGQTVPILITGAFVIEIIFNLPGMGRLTFDAINQRDWLLVQTVFMLSSAVLLLSNLIVDIIYFYLNPKLIDKITN